MFGRLSKPLTEYSQHYIDWSRAGALFMSAHHRYSMEEIRARAGIIALTAFGGLVGAYYGDENQRTSETTTSVLVGASIGFLIAHTITMYPLFQKRREVSRACAALSEEICDMAQHLPDDIAHRVYEVVGNILTSSLSDEKHSRATQTWNRRKRLLTSARESLRQPIDEIKSFWQNEPDTIIAALNALTDPNPSPVARLAP